METNYEKLIYKASTVFSPATPIDRCAFFSGRTDQSTRVIDAIIGQV